MFFVFSLCRGYFVVLVASFFVAWYWFEVVFFFFFFVADTFCSLAPYRVAPPMGF